MKVLYIFLIVIISTLLLTLSVFFISLQSSHDCSQFVIDGYELVSNINMPDIESSFCQYDAGMDLRISQFTIDSTASIYMHNYQRKKVHCGVLFNGIKTLLQLHTNK